MNALLCIWLGIPALLVAAYALSAAYTAFCAALATIKALRPVSKARALYVLRMRPMALYYWSLVAWRPAHNALALCELATMALVIVAKSVIPNPDYSD